MATHAQWGQKWTHLPSSLLVSVPCPSHGHVDDGSFQLHLIVSPALGCFSVGVGVAVDAEAVVVDLTDLSFIDSVGLSVLVSAHQRGEADGIPLEIHSVPPACRRVFEITRLDEVLDLR